MEEAFNKAKADLEIIEVDSERRVETIVELTDQNHNQFVQIQALMLKVINAEKKDIAEDKTTDLLSEEEEIVKS